MHASAVKMMASCAFGLRRDMNELPGRDCRRDTFTDVNLTYVNVSVMLMSVDWLWQSPTRDFEETNMTAAQSDVGEVAVNPRAERSRAALIDAMTSALETLEPGTVLSVAEIARTAGVSRPTLYEHFGDLPNLMRDAAMMRLVALFETVTHTAHLMTNS